MMGIRMIVKLPQDGDVSPSVTGPGRDDLQYIYTGGWSKNRSAIDGNIDFGLMFTPAKRLWFPFVAYGGRARKDHMKVWSECPFRAGHRIWMFFGPFPPLEGQRYLWTNSAEFLNVAVVDMDNDSAVDNTLSKALPINVASGWTLRGDNQYFKRMTSIGQPNEGFGHHTWLANVRWYDDAGLGEQPHNYVIRAMRDALGRVTGRGDWPYTNLLSWNVAMNNLKCPVQGLYIYPTERSPLLWPQLPVRVTVPTPASPAVETVSIRTDGF